MSDLDKKFLEASKLGDVSIVASCLAEGVDLTFKDEDGKTALNYAKEQGHEEVLNEIVNSIKDINKKFVAAAYIGNLTLVTDCLKGRMIRINICSIYVLINSSTTK